MECFQFTIAHPKVKETYVLASELKEDADEWIERIREVAAKNTPTVVPPTPSNGMHTQTIGNDHKVDADAESADGDRASSSIIHAHVSDDADDMTVEAAPADSESEEMIDIPLLSDEAYLRSAGYPQQASSTLRALPAATVTRIEAAVKLLLHSVSADSADEWQPLFDKSGVVAYRKPGAIITVRGDGLVAHPLGKIFQLILDFKRAVEVNPQIETSRKFKVFSMHSSMQYMKFKQVRHNDKPCV